MRDVETINTKKKRDLLILLESSSEEEYKKRKEDFIKKYGAETSHPFYIMCRSLVDYLDEIIDVLKKKKLIIEKKDRVTRVYNDEIERLFHEYKSIIKRTENDDYLLCYGSYVIRQLLAELENKLSLHKNDIYFMKVDELKTALENGKTPLNKIAERRNLYAACKKYDMPLLIKDGLCVYPAKNSNKQADGVTISQGYAKGKIYNLINPGDIYEIMNIPNGSIVYTKWISPVLSSYFFNIKGFILPEKSILSHGAILAREMGIPAIGGIELQIDNGTYVEVNAAEGKINFQI